MKKKKKEKSKIYVKNYGDMLAQVNNMDLVFFEEDGGYQGNYIAIITDGERLLYFIGGYGSCSGCDWLEDMGNYTGGGDKLEVSYKEALNFCKQFKPKFIVPKDKPLKIKNLGEYCGFSIK